MNQKELEKYILELEGRIKKLESEKNIVDNTFLGKLNQGFIPYFFNKFNVRRLLLTTGNAVDPAVEGEIVFHSTTPSLKVKIGGAVKTITVA